MEAPLTYSEVLEHVRIAESYCYIFFISPPREEVFPGDSVSFYYVDDYLTGVVFCARNPICIIIDVKDPDWEAVEKKVREIIETAKFNPTRRFVLCDMERLIANRTVSDHIGTLFRQAIDEHISNIILPERIIRALSQYKSMSE
jgi:hypothetical protein